MSFTLDMQKFIAKADRRADEAVGRIVFGLAANLDYYSPVGDGRYWKHRPPKGYVGGRFRANWQLGVNTVPAGEKAAVDHGAKSADSGGATTMKIAARIPEKAAGNIFWLVNNVPYAQALEYGHSRQAPGPGGIVGRTVIKFRNIVNEAVAEAKAVHP
jgi:hypothetical protein